MSRLTATRPARGTFDMALAEPRIELLDKGGLLRGQADCLLGIGLLQGQPAIGGFAQPILVEDLLDSDCRDPDALQRQPIIGKTVHRTVF